MELHQSRRKIRFGSVTFNICCSSCWCDALSDEIWKWTSLDWPGPPNPLRCHQHCFSTSMMFDLTSIESVLEGAFVSTLRAFIWTVAGLRFGSQIESKIWLLSNCPSSRWTWWFNEWFNCQPGHSSPVNQPIRLVFWLVDSSVCSIMEVARLPPFVNEPLVLEL